MLNGRRSKDNPLAIPAAPHFVLKWNTEWATTHAHCVARPHFLPTSPRTARAGKRRFGRLGALPAHMGGQHFRHRVYVCVYFRNYIYIICIPRGTFESMIYSTRYTVDAYLFTVVDNIDRHIVKTPHTYKPDTRLETRRACSHPGV